MEESKIKLNTNEHPSNFVWVTWALFLDGITAAGALIGFIPILGWIIAGIVYVFVAIIGLVSFMVFAKKRTSHLSHRIKRKVRFRVWKAATLGLAYPWVLVTRPIRRSHLKVKTG